MGFIRKDNNGNGGEGGSVTVVNNLNSSSTASALSANQGKVLNEKIEQVKNSKISLSKIEDVIINKPINVFNPNTATVGKILYSYPGSLETRDNSNGAYSDFIEVEIGEQFTLNGTFGANSVAVMFFTDKDDSTYHSLLRATGFGNYTFTSPINGYMRCNVSIQSVTIDKVMICRGDSYLSVFTPYSEEVSYILNSLILNNNSIRSEHIIDSSITLDKLSNDIQSKLNNETRTLHITNAYVKKGTKLRIPYSSIVSAHDINSIAIKSTYKDGYYKCHYNDFIRGDITKNTSEAIYLYDAKTDVQISGKNFDIIYVDPTTKTNPSITKNILILGDSFVKSGYISKEIKDELDNYGLTNFNFIGEYETFGVKHQGQGGYRISDFLLNPDDMRVNFNHNPFWNNSTNSIDLSYYMNSLNVDGELDYCIIHLGVNDIQNGRSKEEIVQDLLTFSEYIHSSYPNCQILINGLVPAYKDNRQYNAYVYNKNIFNYNDLLFDTLKNLTNITYVPIATTFNSEFAYPFTLQAPYKGSAETEKVLTDNLHPSECGYYMIADIDVLCLINLL